MVEAMDKWRNFIQRSGVDIWTIIEHSIILAHTDHFDQLRLRRDGFAELMFGPRLPRNSHGDSVPYDSLDKNNARSGVYKARQEDNEDVEKEAEFVREEYEEEEEGHRGGVEEGGKEAVQIESDYEDEQPVAEDIVPHDPFDDDVEALTDDIEREKLLIREINSIKNTIDSLPQGRFLPEDETMEILYRVQELNISVNALKDTNIGKSVSSCRKHPSKAVKAKSKEIVSSWKELVDEYYASTVGAPSASANDEAVPVCEEEVGLPSPPLDEGGLIAARTVELSDIFNFSESDLSAASGPSPASEGPSVHHSGRKSSSSPDQERVAREGKGVARVIKLDKHRPVHVESKPDQTQRSVTNSSGNVRKAPNVPSGVRPSTGMLSAAAPRMSAGPSVPHRQQQSGGVRKSDARPTPSVGSIRPRVETTKPGLATKVEPISSDVNERMEASKRKLHANYMMIENAKKQRTVQPLELTDLPKGGPKAQRPGQHRGWVKAK